jgi:predicted nucleic acid-binding protein
MIVVADTTPLNYLILIGHIDILEAQYGRILIPHAVHEEMLDHNAPASVRAWAKNPPHWLELLSPSTARNTLPPNLDRGETEAIQLAEELHSDWLLIDEAAGREEAQRRGLQTIGTLGILRNAHALGLLDLRAALSRLKENGFHMSETLLQTILNSIA